MLSNYITDNQPVDCTIFFVTFPNVNVYRDYLYFQCNVSDIVAEVTILTDYVFHLTDRLTDMIQLYSNRVETNEHSVNIAFKETYPFSSKASL